MSLKTALHSKIFRHNNEIFACHCIDRCALLLYTTENMTFGNTVPVTEQKLTRMQEKGQVTLPVDIRRKLGLKKGDVVAVSETPDGILITPQDVVATKALEEIGEALKAQGFSLEEVIERGCTIRDDLIKKQYGSTSTSDKS